MTDDELRERMVLLAAEAHDVLSTDFRLHYIKAAALREGMVECLIEASARKMEGSLVDAVWHLSSELGKRMSRDGAWGGKSRHS